VERIRRAAVVQASSRADARGQWREAMLWTVAVILLILWLLGFSFHIAGGLIHIILVIVVVVVLIQLFTGRRV
jgi:hypothetical protein